MALFSTFTERVDTGLRMTAAYFFMFLLFFLNIAAVSYPVTGLVKAPVFLMAIYYWAIYRPTLIPSWLTFLAGIIMDLLGGLPLGLNAIVFVATQWIVTDQRRFLMGQSFVMIWIGFAFLCVSSSFMQWALFGLIYLKWPPVVPLLVSSVLGAAVFPVVHVMLRLTHKILPAPYPVMRFSSQS